MSGRRAKQDRKLRLEEQLAAEVVRQRTKLRLWLGAGMGALLVGGGGLAFLFVRAVA